MKTIKFNMKNIITNYIFVKHIVLNIIKHAINIIF